MTMTTSSRLCYHGTNEQVELGDRVELKRLLRKPIQGTVIYLPGVSPRHDEMEWPEFSRWAIELDNGTVMSWPYLPDELQTSKRLRLLARGPSGFVGLQSTDKLN